MNQVTCSLCNTEIDEIKWMDHLVSTNHLVFCKNEKDKIPIKFFEVIFSAYSNESETSNLKIKKTLDFWQSYFATKLPKEKIFELFKDSINNSELEASLTADLLDFRQNSAQDAGQSYLKALEKIKFCRICSLNINKSLLYDHINSKEHSDNEEYFLRKNV